MFPDTYYLLLDAARLCTSICTAWQLNPHYDSLYRGVSQRTLAPIAPYLFTFQPNTEFSNWYFENGWGDSWGILLSTQVSFEECHKHFRRFLLVKTEEGKELYFRFYDPRVLKIFLPSCSRQQIIEFFGLINAFIAEGDTKEQAIIFTHQNGVLQQDILPVTEIFSQEMVVL